jgi:hypothetical protein
VSNSNKQTNKETNKQTTSSLIVLCLNNREKEEKVIASSKVGLYKLLRAIFYFIFLSVSYFLMLAVMTYNAGVFFAVVLGSTLGYAVFTIRPDKMKNEELPPPSCHQ